MPGALGGAGCLEWALPGPGFCYIGRISLASARCSGPVHIDLAVLSPAGPAGALRLGTLTITDVGLLTGSKMHKR